MATSRTLGASPFVAYTVNSGIIPVELGDRETFVYVNEDGVTRCMDAFFGIAGADLNKGDVCYYDLSAGTSVVDTKFTKTNGATIMPTQFLKVGACVALASVLDGERGWFAVKGTIPANVSANVAKGASLALGATAGHFDDADTDYEARGCISLEATTSAGLIEIQSFNDLYIQRLVG